MEQDRIKSILAGMGMAGLIAGTALSVPAVQAASGWGGKPGAGSTQQKPSGSGWGGTGGTVSTDKEQEAEKAKAAKDAKEKEKQKKKEIKPVQKPEQKPGSSGWG